jgi:DNA-binding IclR family transcriptional regulator
VGIVGVQGPAARFDARAIRAAVLVLLEHTASLSAALGLHTSSG